MCAHAGFFALARSIPVSSLVCSPEGVVGAWLCFCNSFFWPCLRYVTPEGLNNRVLSAAQPNETAKSCSQLTADADVRWRERDPHNRHGDVVPRPDHGRAQQTQSREAVSRALLGAFPPDPRKPNAHVLLECTVSRM